MVSILVKLNSPYFSLGEWILSESRPKPIITVLTPSTFSNKDTMGIDPPPSEVMVFTK